MATKTISRALECLPGGGYYTTREVADHYKVSLKTVYRWIEQGKLKAKKFGGEFRISLEAVREFDGKG